MRHKVIYSIMLIVCFALYSCKTQTVYIPVETVKTEYRDIYQRDSIHTLDSVFVDRWKSNDTIYLVKEKYKYLYKDKLIRDSIFINDSIQVAYPVETIKEVNLLKTWQIVLMCLGGLFIGLGGFKIYRFFI